MRANRRTVVVKAVLLPNPEDPVTSSRRWPNTTKADRSSTMLSPPKARSARLPERMPIPIEPATSTTIQSELKYSIEMALLILPFLHSTWLVGQQHPAQFEHKSGAEQFSHEVATHPQVRQPESDKKHQSVLALGAFRNKVSHCPAFRSCSLFWLPEFAFQPSVRQRAHTHWLSVDRWLLCVSARAAITCFQCANVSLRLLPDQREYTAQHA